MAQNSILDKYVYAMDVIELCEYFNTNPVGGTIVNSDVDTLFETTNISDQLLWPWFMSTRTFGKNTSSNPQAYYWSHSNGWVESTSYNYTNSQGKKAVYPTFKIDLSQIEYTIE